MIVGMLDLPNGHVTFLFTDVEGSTRAWEQDPDRMRSSLEQHDAAIEDAVTRNGGVPVKARGEGDSWFVVFESPTDAVVAAAELQADLAVVDWETPEPLSVRASLHTGDADLRDGDYYGPTVNRAARLRAIAHGGQIVLSRSTFELVQDRLPGGTSVEDMGEHGLKDLTRPEHVYQLNVEGLRSEFPPLRSLTSIANNLPVQLTEFVGRETERREIAERIGEARLVTILAAGGSGKTRLAVQVAADISENYPDGVFFVPLADISSGSDIVQTVAEALGIGLSADEDRRSQLLSYLAGKRQLLVFDNFEHVRDEASLVADILKVAPAISVLATSRAKLNVSGEAVYSLSGLDTEWTTPDDAMGTEGVRLFVDAARRVDAGFTIDSDDLDALHTILDTTGGLPLAIVLAAAWVDMLSVSDIASEISSNLDFLETETGDVPDRHRSIRAVFDYSWSLLSDDERATFTALSVFRGGFTRDAAQVVAGASLRGLANLSNKSLLVSDPGAGRYAVHELLRQYSQAELETDTERCAEVQLAHAAYFADLMDSMEPLMFKSDQGLMARTVEADIENIRTAWRRYLSLGDATNSLRFMAMLYFVYEFRGWYPAAIEFFEEAMVAFEGRTEDSCVSARQTARGAAAWFRILIGQVEEGAAEADAALDALPDSTTLLDRWLVVQASAIGNAYMGRADEMTSSLERYFDVYEQLGEPLWACGTKNWLSFSCILRGDFDMAKTYLDGNMEYYSSIDERYFMTWALWLQALMAMNQHQTIDAIDLYRRQGDRSRDIGYLRGLFESSSGLGEASTVAGQYEEAELALTESLEISERMGMITDMVAVIAKIASVRAALGESANAVSLLTMVIDDPVSERQPFTVNQTIREVATSTLDSIVPDMEPAALAAATEAGHGLTFDAVVNDLLGRT